MGLAKSGILPGFDNTALALPDRDNGGERTPPDLWSHIFRPIPQARNGVPVGGDDLGFYDDEDGGIYRCLSCMHEIWGGVCTFCERVYPGHRDIDDGDIWRDEDQGGDFHEPPWLLGDLIPVPHDFEPELEDQDDLDGEEGYESSFIDDADDHGWPLARIRQLSEDVDDMEPDLEPDPDVRQSSPIAEMSEDEDSQDEDVHFTASQRSRPRGRGPVQSTMAGTLRSRHAIRHRIALDSEQSDSEDDDHPVLRSVRASYHDSEDGQHSFEESTDHSDEEEDQRDEEGSFDGEDDEDDQPVRRNHGTRSRRNVSYSEDSE